jgi:hypothetical protein
MIGAMALRLARIAWLAMLCACGGPQSSPDEPQTAKEKQLQEARANGELDDGGGKWGGWRYQGSRDDCFYVAGRRCFKTVKTACATLHCKAPAKCNAVGGGPATVSCATASK